MKVVRATAALLFGMSAAMVAPVPATAVPGPGGATVLTLAPAFGPLDADWLRGELFAAPNHPYTQALLSQVPKIEDRKAAYRPVKGEIPSPLDPPPGCHFHPRCPHAMPLCREAAPALAEIAQGRRSACHLNAKR